MFTGIVEERGEVASLEGSRLEVACSTVAMDSEVGSSVSVNGVCLTVVGPTPAGLSFDVSAETFARSALGRLAPGDPVNLERPVTLAARLGGHIVQGHVDGLGEIIGLQPEASGGARLTVRIPDGLLRYVVEKGSIAVEGVSLTVAAISGADIEVAVIHHTLSATTLGLVRAGDVVNLEVDVIAKYVERLMEGMER